MPSPAGWQPEVPCAECGRRVPGLGWAERCPECRWRRERRASRIASRISLLAAALAAVYVFSRLRTTSTGRLWAALIVLAVYLMVRRIAQKVAYQALPDERAASGEQ
jgi:predicted nucleic acid-binding Zn ribbon protein